MKSPMRDRLFLKLFVTLLATSGMLMLAMVLLMRWSVGRGFVDSLNSVQQAQLARLSAELVPVHQRYGSWEPLRRDGRTWIQLTRQLEGASGDLPPEPPHRDGGFRPGGPGEGFRPGPPGQGFGPPGGGRPFGPGDPDFPPPSGYAEGGMPPPPHRPPPAETSTRQLRMGPRITLFDADHRNVIGPLHSTQGVPLHPVVSNGATVGYLALMPLEAPDDAQGAGFVRHQANALYGIGAGAIVLTAFASLLLARRLLNPVKALARGARELAAGRLTTRVDVTGSDELAQLSADFNHLAATLEANETARRRWVADISHELRTPLAVLRGEIEALQDGVRRLDPAALGSLHSEVVHLGKLVEDLYQLALSDLGALTYHMEPLEPVSLLVEVGEGFGRRFENAGLALMLPPSEGGPSVLGDTRRLSQLFHNLFENSLRYTDAGGRLQVSWKTEGGRLLIDFQDTAPGVPPEALPKLFERLFRADLSRSRAGGGAGLGLAICANIANAHQGRLEAHASPIGGLWLRLALPLIAG